ncbi:hypothetical protein NDU88_004449 [Pleurodeles waltl]|uniref:Uncharacterized protein n=1 Tax=Pleurodeles waltl TaxID=8319 RepID=A0AAV7MA42_PLEWA|nr:hypothetical protein NDU88_004449 [Pleurodeles waltl]
MFVCALRIKTTYNVTSVSLELNITTLSWRRAGFLLRVHRGKIRTIFMGSFFVDGVLHTISVKITDVFWAFPSGGSARADACRTRTACVARWGLMEKKRRLERGEATGETRSRR